jgi:hypothetical protein
MRALLRIGLFLCGATFVTSARAEEPPRNIALADLGLHVVGVGYQRTVTPWMATQLSLNLYGPWTHNMHLLSGSDEPDNDVLGGVVRQRIFFYPLREAPIGPWLSPFAQFGVARATKDGKEGSGSVGAIGVSAGYSFLIAKRVHLAVGLGAQYHAAYFASFQGPPRFGGFYPHLDLNLGYAF